MNSVAVELLVTAMLGVAGMVLALFWLRRRISLTPLYVSLGVLQPVQVMLSSSIYVELWPGLSVSPGTFIFAASLLAILLVYIREDAIQTRKIVYGVLGGNLTMTLVMFMASALLNHRGITNLLEIPPELFSQSARVTAVGTLVFLADVALLIVLYTAVRHRFRRHPFMRVWITMTGVLVFDAIAFTVGAFFERSDFASLLAAAVLSKLLVAACFSAILTFYLRFVEPSRLAGAAPHQPMRDFFYPFTYRDKFELQTQKTDQVEARLAKAQQVARMGFLDWDLDTDHVYWSEEMVRILGFEPGGNPQTAQSTLALIPPEDRALVEACLQRAISVNAAYSMDHRMLRADGTMMWMHAEGELIRVLDDDSPPGFLITLIDVTQRKRAEEERRQMFERITDAFVALDENWTYTFVNSKAAQIFGRTPQDMIGKHLWSEFPEGIGQPFEQSYRQAMADQQPLFIEEYYAPYDQWFENRIYPSPDGLTIYFHDITEKVQQRNRLVQQASQDELTGLPNRRAMREAMDAQLTHDRPRLQPLGCIVLNIDRLHHVNDTLGYAAGDQVLVEVAQRLRVLAEDIGCSLGRIGGDEFLLVPGPLASAGSFEAIARRAAHVLAQPYTVEEQPVYLTCSAGISWYPDAGQTSAQLLGQADLALNIAKQRGRNQFGLYSEQQSADLADRVSVTTEMRQALDRDEFPVALPAAGGRGRRDDRWYRSPDALAQPETGSDRIGPVRFIPIAEDTGMIIRLGDWALRSAIAKAGEWASASGRALPVSVNVSAVQFQRQEFVEEIEDALRNAGVAANLLKLEITESVVMEDTQTAVMMLNRLRQLGVRISLDDFGTGYSSLGQLRQLPIDEIKIDRSFVRDISDDRYAATLCRAVIAMSQQLSFTVVAEGVETAAQARFLKDAGCQVLQGFLFSQPISGDDLQHLLVDDTRWDLDGRRPSRPAIASG